ncbi:xanthine dehydrogenase family protein molybdopterin-binding subunit [Sinorhizobium fredii]|uniref:Isoquinoline 1-oxidoreductase molybdopterin-binding subunit IorB-related protein n=1 Tax=Rhizobium fredii TaxID=380 RepID=A0A2L0HDQ1_RHIFR|nr:molybdopterin cofactor-binding domain-containing protein [Sinorhizobium fredii]AUX79574.1 isoquinoline 1-oxidoreductase molybdopterin-binding subunit IorB-related protein [Sinorhizobium fredii]
MSNSAPGPELNRRLFLKATAAAGGGLIVNLAVGPGFSANAAADFAPNAFIRIDRNGLVTLVMPQVEMGQGIYTAQAMLLAEELEIALDDVKLEHAPLNEALYAHPMLGRQMTGGSTSIRAFWTPLRRAGAMARTLLIRAAAKEWDVDPATTRAEDGFVLNENGTKKLAYGVLVDIAASLPAPDPEDVVLKSPEHFKLLGRSAKRLDTPGKVNGSLKYGIDAFPVGTKIAAIAIAPVLGGKPKSANEQAALAIKGVRQVVLTDSAVAVVADHTGAAKKGLEAAAIEWDDGPNAHVSSAEIVRHLDQESVKPGAIARSEGDVEKALASAAQRIDAVYQLPFLSHAAMEPMNCTVHVRKDACELWVGTQNLSAAKLAAAAVTGLPPEKITINNHIVGGGFGRRLEVDGIIHAVKVAMQVDGPVKVIWSREEDIQHGYYRPYYYDRMSGGIDEQGNPVAWRHRISGSSIFARIAPAAMKNGVDPDGVEGAVHPPYRLPAIQVEFNQVEPQGVLTSWWRGVGPAHNVFMVESFIDELAAAAKVDPVGYRTRLLTDNPRALKVLELAAEKAEWGKPLPARQGRGVAVQFAFGTYLAMIADATVGGDGAVRVTRIVTAVDCGLTVNPDTIAAQMEGGALYGLTAALYGAITLKDGRVEQSNFDNYLPLRIDEAPHVETHIVPSAEPPGGIGEAATAAVFPAVTNAIFSATGKRVRTLPVNTDYLRKA